MEIKSKIKVTCEICYLNYNETENKPMSLPCGHSICLECLKKFERNDKTLKCPFDNKFINYVNNVCKPNYTVLKLISNDINKINIKENKDLNVENNKIEPLTNLYCLNKHKMKWVKRGRINMNKYNFNSSSYDNEPESFSEFVMKHRY